MSLKIIFKIYYIRLMSNLENYCQTIPNICFPLTMMLLQSHISHEDSVLWDKGNSTCWRAHVSGHSGLSALPVILQKQGLSLYHQRSNTLIKWLLKMEWLVPIISIIRNMQFYKGRSKENPFGPSYKIKRNHLEFEDYEDFCQTFF